MPVIDYQCRECEKAFSRVVLRGEENRLAVCPRCRRKTARPVDPNRGLFKGISNFSNLSRDTN